MGDRNETMQRKVNIVTQILLDSDSVEGVIDKLQLQGLQYFAVRKKQVVFDSFNRTEQRHNLWAMN